MAQPPRTTLPTVFKTLAWFLALDLLVAYWLAIHDDKALQLFLSLIPAAGIAGLAWGFFSDARKAEFSAWLEGWFGAGGAPWIAAVVFLTALVLTSVRAGVTVTSLDGGIATRLWLTQDTTLDAASRAAADSANLNAATSPVSFIRWLGPSGQDVWLVSEQLISKQLVRLRPWRPRELAYPQDFDSLVTIALLPGGWIFNQGDSARVTLLGSRDEQDTLAAFSIGNLTSYQLSLRPQAVAPDTVPWRRFLQNNPLESPQMALHWATAPQHVPTRRPVRKGELVTWRVVAGAITRQQTVALANSHEDIYLAR